ncbi:hypothetical protein K431DRAFT_283216 [Polychaeton citri CBS 116435]|uniref:Uncharacterized protein n=1 Tax=Polychaeton citri CBS 116435 TaxID=1314669 RepID=A0A9P4QAY1_9PEZI|nr:hypothetical protein K431DRAFT_283216 [Polychaeton citri CBS 116435]
MDYCNSRERRQVVRWAYGASWAVITALPFAAKRCVVCDSLVGVVLRFQPSSSGGEPHHTAQESCKAGWFCCRRHASKQQATAFPLLSVCLSASLSLSLSLRPSRALRRASEMPPVAALAAQWPGDGQVPTAEAADARLGVIGCVESQTPREAF